MFKNNQRRRANRHRCVRAAVITLSSYSQFASIDRKFRGVAETPSRHPRIKWTRWKIREPIAVRATPTQPPRFESLPCALINYYALYAEFFLRRINSRASRATREMFAGVSRVQLPCRASGQDLGAHRRSTGRNIALRSPLWRDLYTRASLVSHRRVHTSDVPAMYRRCTGERSLRGRGRERWENFLRADAAAWGPRV